MNIILKNLFKTSIYFFALVAVFFTYMVGLKDIITRGTVGGTIAFADQPCIGTGCGSGGGGSGTTGGQEVEGGGGSGCCSSVDPGTGATTDGHSGETSSGMDSSSACDSSASCDS
jgi:hypothetical protein